MKELMKAKQPFQFYTRLHLTELTGLRASILSQLLDIIKKIPDSSIYHHTHRFLQQYEYLSPEPPNDFVYWVTEILGEEKLGKELSSINTIEYVSIHDLRQKIVEVIEHYSKKHPLARVKFAKAGEEFHFLKSISFIIPTKYIANDLKEFSGILEKITIDSIYFHIFEARLRLGRGDNDFSNWIESSIGEKELAEGISTLDPYTYTLEELRKTLLRIIEKSMSV